MNDLAFHQRVLDLKRVSFSVAKWHKCEYHAGQS